MSEEKIKLSPITPEAELERRLLSEDDTSEMKNIIDLFNLNILKKNVIRISKLNNLLDKVYNQIEKRLETYPDNFSNKDLLDYFKTFQDTIDKSNISTEELKIPTILVNLLNINISNGLSIESRKRVADTVKNILDKYKSQEIVEEYKEVKED